LFADRKVLDKASALNLRRFGAGKDSTVDKRKKIRNEGDPGPATVHEGKVKFEVFGEEMIEKEVKLSGNSGRVYLPPDWVGKQIKVIRIN
jgi:putative transposon-encoded protein